jgi:nucleotide-binding universal stress UspA family protein
VRIVTTSADGSVTLVPMTLLVAYQPSRAGDAALDAAVLRAQDTGADLAVACVVPEEVSRSCCSISTGRWKEILEEDARAALSRARARVDGARDVDYLIVRGRPADALAAAARERGAAVVMVPGSPRGRTARTLRRAGCDVVTG